MAVFSNDVALHTSLCEVKSRHANALDSWWGGGGGGGGGDKTVSQGVPSSLSITLRARSSISPALPPFGSQLFVVSLGQSETNYKFAFFDSYILDLRMYRFADSLEQSVTNYEFTTSDSDILDLLMYLFSDYNILSLRYVKLGISRSLVIISASFSLVAIQFIFTLPSMTQLLM